MPDQIITPVLSRRVLFSDFHKTLAVNPFSKDLAAKKDEEAVKESIKNLILTDKGERLMQPYLGGNIRALLFENITPAVTKMIQEQIRTTIETYEPRASLIDVNVLSSIDENKVEVGIYFYINNVVEPIALSVFLERTR